jgi:peptide-methionine (S)-S-oxide reductase
MKHLLLLLAMSATALTAADSAKPKTELATIGGGCFWCVEAQYKFAPGVLKAISGYAGGTKENPTYEEVCAKTTGHAEVVQIEFDPAKISYKEIIDLFWDAHDPTTLNRQGNDVGPQYRSIILYHSDEQKKIAEASKAAAQKKFTDPIVTEIVPLKKFYPAEDEHQNYAAENPYQGYVRGVVAPKVEKFKHKLEEKAKAAGK